MTMNDKVSEYLDYYLSSELETDFAVMLNGPWGAGKTHFVKTYFQSREDKAKSMDPLHRGGHLYASLYGIRSASEITDQFFAQAHPVMNSKAARLIGTVMSRALNGFAGTDVNSESDNKSLIKEMVLKLEGQVLIFDDLERCAMPLVEAMGFINSFVEHDRLKVIVIANETDIPTDQQLEYTRKKEKLIGKTLGVASDPHIVLDTFCKKLTHRRVLEVVSEEKLALLKTFEGSGKRNFRSLRAVLSDFERLVATVHPGLQNSDVGMAQLLLFMVATGVELRGGDLSAAELANLPSTRQSGLIASISKKEKSPDILKAEGLAARYPQVRWDDPIVPPAALAVLFESGIVATDAINAHLSQHPLVVGYAQSPAWRQLWSWTDLSRSQYLNAREELVRELDKRELTHPGVILHAAGIVIGTASFGDYMLGTGVDIVAYFENYVQDLQASGKLEPARDLFTPMGGAYGGLGYGCKDTVEFRAIYKTVRAATNRSFENLMEETAGTFIERISRDRQSYSSLHKYGIEEGNYADAPFLHHIDPDAFASLIIEDSSPNGMLLASLHARYEMEKHNRALSVEYPWISVLRSHLEAIASKAEPPHQELLAIRIKYYFDKIEEAIGPRPDPSDIHADGEDLIDEELAG
jgi:hypothetical protein